MFGRRLSAILSFVLAACNVPAPTETEDPEVVGSTPSACTEADPVVDGVAYVELAVCAVSTEVDPVTVEAYIASLPPLRGLDCWTWSECRGEVDGHTYQRVAYGHDVVVDAWNYEEAVFGPDGLLQWWVPESNRGMHCNTGLPCYTCCDRYCCDGVATSMKGLGVPVPLVECLTVDSACAYDSTP